MNYPMGFNVNNPGDIRYNIASSWRGQIGSHSGFCSFMSPDWGLRAVMVLLDHYVARGADTIRKIINIYAPPGDNNPTEAYETDVANFAGVGLDDAIEWNDDTRIAIVKGIVRRELSGGLDAPAGLPPNWYDDAVYQRANDLYLNPSAGNGSTA